MSAELPKVMEVEASTKRPLKICLVYSRAPFPMMRGDQLTISHLISYFHQRGHLVDFVTLDNDGHLNQNQKEWLQESCKEVYLIPYSILHKAFNLLFGFLKSLPLQVALFTSNRQKRLVKKLDSEKNYDIIYTYYLRSAEIGANYNGKNVLALQLSQYLNTHRIAVNSTNPIKKLIYSVEAALIKKYEAKIIDRFSKVGVIGDKDLEAINNVLTSQGKSSIANYFYSAHGTDINRFKVGVKEDVVSGRIVFSGNMSYEPNVQAITWFVQYCFEKIQQLQPDVQLYIVGKEPKPAVLSLASENIIVTGTVPDPYEYIKTAAICINTVKAAGGMQNKLIEYLASGKVTIATSIANEGIKAPEEALVIANEPEEFIDAVNDILAHPDKYETMSKNARKFVEDNWTWESHFSRLEDEFYELASD